MTEQQLFKKHNIKIEPYAKSCWILVNRSEYKPSYRGRNLRWKHQPIVHKPFDNRQEALTSINKELT